MSHHVVQENHFSSHLLSSIFLSPLPKLHRLTLTTSESCTSLWGLVTLHYSLFPPVAETLLNLRGGLSLGYLVNPFWKPQRPTNVIPAQTPETPVSCQEACRGHGAHPAILVETCWARVALTWHHQRKPDGICTLSAEMLRLSPYLPLCIGVTELYSQSPTHLFWGRMIWNQSFSMGVFIPQCFPKTSSCGFSIRLDLVLV